MKILVSKKMFGHSLLIFIIVCLTGAILFPFTTNIYVLCTILIIQYIVLLIILFYFYNKYIKPIDKATRTMEKLLKGNYHARIHHQMDGSIGELSIKINELARSLNELKIQEQIQAEQLSTIIENSDNGLILIDEKGYIHIVNRKFISMFGNTPQDYIGYLYYEVIENEEIHHTIQETFLREKTVKQLISIAENGERFYYEIISAPIFNEINLLKGTVLAVYDITEFKLVETMRKDFVANVSHELKTPITSIRGFAETLLDGASNDTNTRNYFLSIIFEESKRIQYLIEDLLILSKLEKEAYRLHVSKIDFQVLLNDILPVLKISAQKKNIELEVHVDTNSTFQADEEKMKQVLINLLTNAISYSLENGQVSLKVTETSEDICFIVKDNGIGMGKQFLPRIFERFYRIDKDRSRDTGGTGLGLAIVKHIVEIHDGKIDVESELGKGTTFYVYIPKNVKLKK